MKHEGPSGFLLYESLPPLKWIEVEVKKKFLTQKKLLPQMGNRSRLRMALVPVRLYTKKRKTKCDTSVRTHGVCRLPIRIPRSQTTSGDDHLLWNTDAYKTQVGVGSCYLSSLSDAPMQAAPDGVSEPERLQF